MFFSVADFLFNLQDPEYMVPPDLLRELGVGD